MRNNNPITVRLWVPDGNDGYVLLESLPPGKLAAFRKQTSERIAAAFQRCVNERPELLNALPDRSGVTV